MQRKALHLSKKLLRTSSSTDILSIQRKAEQVQVMNFCTFIKLLIQKCEAHKNNSPLETKGWIYMMKLIGRVEDNFFPTQVLN